MKWVLLVLTGFIANPACQALDLAPRQWAHLPLGTNFAGVAYANTDADILFDPTLKIEDAEMSLDTWVAKYIRTFELLSKTTRIEVTQAYQEGDWQGLLDGVSTTVKRSGLSDTFLRLAVNLYGAPPLGGKEFAAYRDGTDPETIVGLGLAVRLPTGKYLEDKLINLGQNRFAFRPQLGVIHSRGKWTFETTGEVAFYTENDEFFNQNVREQKPRHFIHAHLTYTLRPGLWVSAGVGYDVGGENEVNGVDKDDKNQNIGWACSFAYPINRQVGISFAYIGTRSQESVGFDSDTLSAALAIAW